MFIDSKQAHYTGDYHFKPEERYKKFEIMYSLKSTWEVINGPQVRRGFYVND